MTLKYGFIGVHPTSGEKKLFWSHHHCCLGALPDASSKLFVAGYKAVQGKVVFGTVLTRKEFDYWYGRLAKDFPTYRVNGVDYKAPKAAYYDASGKRSGNLNYMHRDKVVGPMGAKVNYVILTFPEKVNNDITYVGLKFYMKNLSNPYLADDFPTRHMPTLWAEAEKRLKEAGLPTTMGCIMTATSMSNGSHTLNYGWPVGSGKVNGDALKKLLQNSYECTDFTENQEFMDQRYFSIHNPKNTPKYLFDHTPWGPKLGPVPSKILMECSGWQGAIDRIKECLE